MELFGERDKQIICQFYDHLGRFCKKVPVANDIGRCDRCCFRAFCFTKPSEMTMKDIDTAISFINVEDELKLLREE